MATRLPSDPLTTDRIRDLYAWAYAWRSADDIEGGDTDLSRIRSANRDDFDRWLVEHDRATAERAWDELYCTQFDGAPFEMSDTTGVRDPNNPYREED